MTDREWINECDCGTELRSPVDGDTHEVRCPVCHLLAHFDETGDILHFENDEETREARSLDEQRKRTIDLRNLTDEQLVEDYGIALIPSVAHEPGDLSISELRAELLRRLNERDELAKALELLAKEMCHLRARGYLLSQGLSLVE